MAALGELVSTTTHEFNNVLTTIINYAKLGLRHKDEASRDKALDENPGRRRAGRENHQRRARAWPATAATSACRPISPS